jgi:hypothetical protein
MAKIPDGLLIKPDHIARQIENAYREGVADRQMDGSNAEKTWPRSFAAGFAAHYKRIAQEAPKDV